MRRATAPIWPILMGLAACSDDDSSTRVAAADVELAAGGSFQDCNFQGICAFVGLVQNLGPDCAESLSGTVAFLDDANRQVGNVRNWTISDRLTRNSFGSYRISNLAPPVTTESKTFRVEGSWTAVGC